MAAPQRPAFPANPWPQRLRHPRPLPLAVGGRAVVVCPNDPRHRVALTDASGNAAVGSLTDGAEVEIIAWHPRGQTGWRYQVRSRDGAIEGWLSAANLGPLPPR